MAAKVTDGIVSLLNSYGATCPLGVTHGVYFTTICVHDVQGEMLDDVLA